MILAALISYLLTIVSVLITIAAARRTRASIATLREHGRWWWWAMGACGVPIVLAMSGGIPIVGIAIASVCAVAGQTVSGMFLDARGIGRDDVMPRSRMRLLAGLVAVAGLAVAVVGSGHVDASAWTVAGIGLALFAGGVAIPIQTAGSGRVAGIAGDPLLPCLTAVFGGTAVMLVVTAVSAATGGLDGVSLPGADRWWLYLGGPLGMLITVGSAFAVRRLGAFMLTLAVVGGQMVVSILLDLERSGEIHWPTVAAALVVCMAVVLAVPKKHKPEES
jgi:transporter family-2 protein